MKRFIGIILSVLFVLLLSSQVYGFNYATASIVAQNTFTDSVRIKEYGTLRLTGTWSATVTLQRSDDGGVTWIDTGDTETANGVFTFTDHTNQLYRAGVKTGQYSSGTVSIWLGSAW